MRLLDPELTHEQRAVLCMTGDADGPLDRAAASEARAVVGQKPVVIDQDRLLHERLGPCSAHAPVDEHDGVSHSPQFVLQLQTVDGRPIRDFHGDLFVQN